MKKGADFLMFNNNLNILCIVSKSISNSELDLISDKFRNQNVTLKIVSNFTQKSLLDINENISCVDGVIFFGGEEDISPTLYGNKQEASRRVDKHRDNYEITLFKIIVAQNIPCLGICRGMQLMNIAFGGTLFQDIKEKCYNHYGNWDDYCETGKQLMHKVVIGSNTKLFKMINKTKIIVNSYHHQAVNIVGKELLICAYSIDGIIEGLEHRTKPILGVQWHPELMTNKESDDIFIKFTQLVRENRIQKCKFNDIRKTKEV